ncbi:MAG: cob(I)yrinic acid a,c-diamide adenosyltransferase [Gemmatimonas sp.]|nr:cob(I)yrinic acid a,c-diamide adenosyltransferase [Gemmatimonas sp.]
MKIYTRTGDAGETGLFGGGRVPKDDFRVEAYGQVDELNAILGSVAAASEVTGGSPMLDRLRQIQEDLFAIGAYLATPSAETGRGAAKQLPALPIDRITEMERWIDEAEKQLPALRAFVLPGGTENASRLHVARTVCRRAERRVLTLHRHSPLDSGILVYLNRLSDLLFMLARLANQEGGREDILWVGRR